MLAWLSTASSQGSLYHSQRLTMPMVLLMHEWSIQSIHKVDRLDPRASLMPVYIEECDISLHAQQCMFLLVKTASSDAYLQAIRYGNTVTR